MSADQFAANLRIVEVTPHALASMVSGRAFRWTVEVDGVRIEDAELVRWFADDERQVVCLVVAHPFFSNVQYGVKIPRATATCEEAAP